MPWRTTWQIASSLICQIHLQIWWVWIARGSLSTLLKINWLWMKQAVVSCVNPREYRGYKTLWLRTDIDINSIWYDLKQCITPSTLITGAVSGSPGGGLYSNVGMMLVILKKTQNTKQNKTKQNKTKTKTKQKTITFILFAWSEQCMGAHS